MLGLAPPRRIEIFFQTSQHIQYSLFTGEHYIRKSGGSCLFLLHFLTYTTFTVYVHDRHNTIRILSCEHAQKVNEPRPHCSFAIAFCLQSCYRASKQACVAVGVAVILQQDEPPDEVQGVGLHWHAPVNNQSWRIRLWQRVQQPQRE